MRRERVAFVTRTGMSVNTCRQKPSACARSASITFSRITNRGEACSGIEPDAGPLNNHQISLNVTMR